MRRTGRVVAAVTLAFLLGCGAGGKPSGAESPAAALPDVRLAKDRPPVVLVSREGDPMAALSVAVAVPALTEAADAEPAVALAGMVEARLLARGLDARVTPQWDGYRVVALVSGAEAAARTTRLLREALAARVGDADVAAAKGKLAALGKRPLSDVALLRWARCTSALHALPARAGKSGTDLTGTQLESWRKGAHVRGNVAYALAGPRAVGEAVAGAVARDSAWDSGDSGATRTTASSGFDADVYDATAERIPADARVYVTLDVGSSSAAVATAEALGDVHGPLSTRLSALEVPFRVRDITGAAHASGGCVGVVLESVKAPLAAAVATGDWAARVADAVALVRLEAVVHLADQAQALDGRVLARRAGDARDAAERAAWWALSEAPGAASKPPAAPRTIGGFAALGVPRRRGAQDTPLEPTRPALTAALTKANASWEKPVVEGRVRVEPGQGESWVLVASPCGTDGESEADAGLTALFVVAAASAAAPTPDVRVEPWIVADGAGLVAHGPARPGESPAAHARRLADVAAEAFAARPLTPAALARAQGELASRGGQADVSTLGVLANALAPGRPSSVVPWGQEDTVVKAADAAVVARAEALRAGPIRTAVLASRDMSEIDAAVRATDRWVERHGEGERTCRASPRTAPPRAGTYAARPRPGSAPEALLAYPFAGADPAAARAARVLVEALDGPNGLLSTSVVPMAGVARSAGATILGSPRAPALVLRVTADEATLDGAVMQARALVDRIHREGLPGTTLERSLQRSQASATTRLLDPRARLVSAWRGDALADGKAAPAATAEELRAFTQRWLGEESLIVVASRAERPTAP